MAPPPEKVPATVSDQLFEDDSPQPASFGIGEVLSRLKPEFPDVTVSKIRFLEAQGLVDPGRTAAGYPRFGEDDLARLVWILRQQRENFLPLKVIGELLERAGGVTPDTDTGSDVRPFREHGARTVAGSVSITLEELANAAAVSTATVGQLEKMGLIEGHAVGSITVYDDDALLIARLAAVCLGHGLDVRHLRMHLVAAQREAGVLEQILRPRLRGDDKRTLAAVRTQLEELVEAGAQIRDVMRRRSMGRLGRLVQ